jgi:hypothetical protein
MPQTAVVEGTVESAVDELVTSSIRRIEKCEELGQEARRHCLELLTTIRRDAGQEAAIAVAKALYWGTDIRTSDLGKAVGQGNPYYFLPLIGPICMICECDKCGTDVDVMVASRAELKPLLSKNSRNWKSKRFCAGCLKRKEEASRQYRNRASEESREWAANREGRLEELQAMSYEEYLQTPEWAALRKRALRKAGFRCQLCNKQGELHVHHRTYDAPRGEEDVRDLTVLCKKHHKGHHGK